MMFTIRGIPTAGIAVGTAFVLQRRASAAATAAAGDPVAEAGRFHAALERAKAELSALAEGEAVFAAHLEMAGDPMLAGLVEGRIAEKHLSAEQALGEACEEVCGMFAALDDDYLRVHPAQHQSNYTYTFQKCRKDSFHNRFLSVK